MVTNPQCLSFPTWAGRLLGLCGLQGLSRAVAVSTWEWPQSSQASPDALPVGCREQVACLARWTASWSPAAPCSPRWPARGPCSSLRWAARTSTLLCSWMTSPRKGTPTSTMPTAAAGWRGKGGQPWCAGKEGSAGHAIVCPGTTALGPLPWGHCPGATALGLSWQLAAPWPPIPSLLHLSAMRMEVDSRAPGIARTFPPPHLPISEGQGPVWGHQHVPGHR